MHMLNYPETVLLAGLLASEHWRQIASVDRRCDRRRFDVELARRLDIAYIGFGAGDPFVSWQDGEAVARRRRLHEQLGYHGPKVWLSLGGE
jgi:hypothetical protein